MAAHFSYIDSSDERAPKHQHAYPCSSHQSTPVTMAGSYAICQNEWYGDSELGRELVLPSLPVDLVTPFRSLTLKEYPFEVSSTIQPWIWTSKFCLILTRPSRRCRGTIRYHCHNRRGLSMNTTTLGSYQGLDQSRAVLIILSSRRTCHHHLYR